MPDGRARTTLRRSKPRGAWSHPRLAGSVAFGFDPLLANLLGNLALVGDRVFLQPDALLRRRLLVDDRDLLVQHHLVLLLGDLRPVEGLLPVGLSDRLALDAKLLALNRHGGLHLFGHDVLAQPSATGFPLGLANEQLFF